MSVKLKTYERFPLARRMEHWVLLYNLRISKTPQRMGQYSFDEKFEYWAFVWGYSVMGITGFIIWSPITATKYLPGEFVPAAKAAHGGEAVLAVLAILIWHLYHVGVRRSAKLMVTGPQTDEEMKHEHPLELDAIKAGIADRGPGEHDCIFYLTSLKLPLPKFPALCQK